MKKQMNIFVSGEEGLIAKTLIVQLKSLGHTIANENSKFDIYRTYDHTIKNANFMFKNVNRKLEVDIRNLSFIDLFKNVDMIIHCASYVNTNKVEHDLEGACSSNVLGTLNLAHIAKTLNILFVNFSTTATMNPRSYNGNTLKLCEETERLPRTYYGQTKMVAEYLVKWNLEKYLNFLPVFFVGPFPLDNSSELVKIIYHTIHNTHYDVTLSEQNFKAYFWCEDACDAIIRIIFNPESWKLDNKDFVIATYDIHKYQDYLDLIKQKLGVDSLPITFLSDKDYLGNHISSAQKSRKYSIGWEQKVFAPEIIDRIIQSIKDNEIQLPK